MSAEPDPVEETKRKFAAALAAKKSRQGDAGVDDHGHEHVQSHGPVDAKRMYRRKTG